MSNTHQKELAAKSPEDWLASIKALPKKMRVHVANIVYWDYFGDQSASERWPHLDEWIAPVPEGVIPEPWPDPETLSEALILVGYQPHLACIRARTSAEEQRNYDRICAGAIPKTKHHARQSIDAKMRKDWPAWDDPDLNVSEVRKACNAFFLRKGLRCGKFGDLMFGVKDE